MSRSLRVVSWNVASRSATTALRQGAYLASLDPDIVLLQEVKAASAPVLRDAAGLDWLRCSLEERPRGADEGPGRGLGCAIGARRVESCAAGSDHSAVIADLTLN